MIALAAAHATCVIGPQTRQDRAAALLLRSRLIACIDLREKK
jgi:hypothetical protein